MAFYALLALFPAMAALVWIGGLLVDPATAAERLRFAAAGVLPGGAAEVAGELLGRLASRPGGGFGLGAGAAAVGAALWGGTAAAAQLFGALNAAYGERETRGLLRLYASALLFALGAGASWRWRWRWARSCCRPPSAPWPAPAARWTRCSDSGGGRSSSPPSPSDWRRPTGTARAASARGGSG